MLVLSASGKLNSPDQGVVDSDQSGFFCLCGLCRKREDLGKQNVTVRGKTLSRHTQRQRAASVLREREWYFDRRLGWLCTECADRQDLESVKHDLLTR